MYYHVESPPEVTALYPQRNTFYDVLRPSIFRTMFKSPCLVYYWFNLLLQLPFRWRAVYEFRIFKFQTLEKLFIKRVHIDWFITTTATLCIGGCYTHVWEYYLIVYAIPINYIPNSETKSLTINNNIELSSVVLFCSFLY